MTAASAAGTTCARRGWPTTRATALSTATAGCTSVGNLYLGGSSVFSTAGHANPTYTIVELALRLGDHLTARLAA